MAAPRHPVITAFVNPFTSDVTAEAIGIYLRRVTVVSTHILAGQAIDNSEGMAFKHTFQYRQSQRKNVTSLHSKAD